MVPVPGVLTPESPEPMGQLHRRQHFPETMGGLEALRWPLTYQSLPAATGQNLPCPLPKEPPGQDSTSSAGPSGHWFGCQNPFVVSSLCCLTLGSLGVVHCFFFLQQLNPRSKAFWKRCLLRAPPLRPQPQPLRSGAPLKENVHVHRAGESGGFGTSVMKSRRPDATRTLLASRREGSLSRCSGRLTVLQPMAGSMERGPHKPLSAPGFHRLVQPSPGQGRRD